MTVTVDRVAGTIVSTQPVTSQYFGGTGAGSGSPTYAGKPINVLAGTAVDAGPAGADVQTVQVTIKQSTSTLYWDGDGFDVNTSSWILANGTTVWWYLPSPAPFITGWEYQAQARMLDRAGNISTDPASGFITFLYDTAVPTVSVLEPNAAFEKTLTVLSGIAGDNLYALPQQNAGIERIEVSIRVENGAQASKYWSQNSGVEATEFDTFTENWWPAVGFTAGLSTADWRYTNIPTWVVGQVYTVRVRILDRARNLDAGPVANVSSVTFRYDPTPPTVNIGFLTRVRDRQQ